MSKKNGRAFVPPPNYHDIETGLEPVRHLLELDLADMRAQGDVGPHTKLARTRTRLPQAIEVLTGSGEGLGERDYPPTDWIDTGRKYGLAEARFLGANRWFDADWLDTLNLNLHGNRVYHYTDAISTVFSPLLSAITVRKKFGLSDSTRENRKALRKS